MLSESALSNDVPKLCFGHLEQDKATKLFNIKKFKQNMNEKWKGFIQTGTKLRARWMLLFSEENKEFSSFGSSSVLPLLKPGQCTGVPDMGDDC